MKPSIILSHFPFENLLDKRITFPIFLTSSLIILDFLTQREAADSYSISLRNLFPLKIKQSGLL